MTKKLDPQLVEVFAQHLERLRRDLSGDIENLAEEALGNEGVRAPVDHPADGGSDNFSQEFSLGLLARDEETLREVIDALDRVRKGVFGICESCRGPVGLRRLRTVPHARHCITCQRDIEQGKPRS